MSKVLLVIANKGYQVKEYEDTKKALVLAGHEVVTAGMKSGKAISNIMTKVNVDIIVDDIKIEDYDAMYLIGGPLALDYLDNEKIYSLLNNFFKNTDKPYGAICISPRILVNAGVVEGKKITGWNDDLSLNEICEKNGVFYIDEHVVKDGRVITADGPMSANDFGKMIAEQIR